LKFQHPSRCGILTKYSIEHSVCAVFSLLAHKDEVEEAYTAMMLLCGSIVSLLTTVTKGRFAKIAFSARNRIAYPASALEERKAVAARTVSQEGGVHSSARLSSGSERLDASSTQVPTVSCKVKQSPWCPFGFY
jgi:hypothetical protein